MASSKELDQYFTKKHLAAELYVKTKEIIGKLHIQADCWLEPAAGDGSFFNLLPPNSRMGIDIDKRLDEVVEADFLLYQFSDDRTFISIGNPPFGKNSSLAIKFFNRCAKVSSVIAFIVPKTFNKSSVTNKLDLNFHLIYNKELPDNSFEIDGQDKHVPCTLEIWIKQPELREKIYIHRNHADLEFLPLDQLDEATILFQRVGAKAGMFKSPNTNTAKAPPSHYYIRCSKQAEKILRSITEWPTKFHTAGNPSISKSDLIQSYERAKYTFMKNLWTSITMWWAATASRIAE